MRKYTLVEVTNMNINELEANLEKVLVSIKDHGVWEEYYFFELGPDYSEEERNEAFGVAYVTQDGEVEAYTLCGYEHDIKTVQ